MKNLQEIRARVAGAVDGITSFDFIYDLLRAYDLPRASVTRLETGDYNLADADGEILWKKRLLFVRAASDRLRSAAEEAVGRADVGRHEPRFVVATDLDRLVAHDLKTRDTLEIPLEDLASRYEFFLPWAGIEKAQVYHENPADIKAAEKMARLYDQILEANPDAHEASHDLNVFFARILFCLFAEDTGIFEKSLFTKTLEQVTEEHEGNVPAFLEELFVALDTEARDSGQPFYLRDFPYVNGGLFAERIKIPEFSPRARRVLIECGSELDWSEINPDIFGSMVQAVVREDQREDLGMHYTSVPNIMKVIGPLFLDDLRREFEGAKGSRRKLQQLWARIAKIKFFDPACGSGNFLIITYKEIRKLEMEIIAGLESLAGGQGEIYLSRISLDQFYGIEIDDFAHEVAMLSLWLAEHQMNMVFQERFGRVQPYLPLRQAGHVVHGNAALLNWTDICPAGSSEEVFVMGNPPYQGSRKRSDQQKQHLRMAVGDEISKWKTLDYIAVWFLKGAEYLRCHSKSSLALVTTSSISQGDQVGILWPKVLGEDLEIGFAYQPFRWTNSARGQAGVVVSIIGLQRRRKSDKTIYSTRTVRAVSEISPYLIEGPADLIVTAESEPPPGRPEMLFGNMPRCGGNLVVRSDEREAFLRESPEAERYLRRYIGSKEFLSGEDRWCLWIDDDELEKALSYTAVRERVEGVRQMRLDSRAAATRKLADRAHAFAQRNCVGDGSPLVVPSAGTDRRDYVPLGYDKPGTIVSNLAYAVYGADLWLFGILASRMHMIWVKTVGGRLKNDPRYTSTLCYNTFPIPDLSPAREERLSHAAKDVVVAREHHSEKTLADLYDPDDMPDDLREAHAELDLAVDRCYRSRPFASDEERLQLLFEMYEDLTRANDS